MKSQKTFFNSLLVITSLLGASIVSEKPAFSETSSGPECLDPSTTTITSINDMGDSTSFYNLTLDPATGFGGFCRGTPESYGVTVYKMGFCKNDPGDPDGASGEVRAGLLPDYSDCTWTYDNDTGELAEFSSGATVDLSALHASPPAVGVYPHAVMIISKDFRIKGSFGPVGGKTYYSTSTFEVSSNDPADNVAVTAPLTTFWDNCTAITEENTVDGGTIDAYLLDSSGKILVNNDNIDECTGQEKLLGVMNMSSDIVITPTTRGLNMTFKVENNGMSVNCNDDCTDIIFDSGPFSVVFDTF